MKWFKVYGQELLNDERLMSMTRSQKGLWLELMCIASIQKPPGQFSANYLQKVCNFDAKCLARVRQMADFFHECSGNFQVVNWHKYQDEYQLKKNRLYINSGQTPDSVGKMSIAEVEEEDRREERKSLNTLSLRQEENLVGKSTSYKKSLTPYIPLSLSKGSGTVPARIIEAFKFKNPFLSAEKIEIFFAGELANGRTVEEIEKAIAGSQHNAGLFTLFPTGKAADFERRFQAASRRSEEEELEEKRLKAQKPQVEIDDDEPVF